jgi:hypothetical protein
VRGDSVPVAVLPTIFLVGCLLVAFLSRPKTRPTPRRLTFVASNLWILDHLCLAVGRILHEWPELEEARFDIGALAVLDEASLASLARASATAAAAGIRLRVDGYDARMASLMLSRGMSAEHLGAPRNPGPEPARTIH